MQSGRWWLRMVFGAVLGLLFLSMYTGGISRGFLPRVRRDLWLSVMERDGGRLEVRLAGVGAEPSGPLRLGETRVQVMEQSMGRMDHAEWTGWRASTWWPCFVEDCDGWRPSVKLPKDAPLMSPAMERAVSEFVMFEVIPDSPVMAMWPGIPRKWRVHSDGGWGFGQHRMYFWMIVGSVVVCAGLGLGVASVVLPRGRNGGTKNGVVGAVNQSATGCQ